MSRRPTSDTHTILTCSAEAAPFVEGTRLGGRVAALTGELAELGQRVVTFLPRCGSIDPEILTGFERVHRVGVPIGGELVTATVWRGRQPGSGVVAYLLEDATSEQSDDAAGTGDAAEARRWIFYCRAVVETLRGLGLRPDVVHAHDHQAALIVAYLKTLYSEDSHLRNVASLFTIHDLARQGIHDRDVLRLSGLPSDVFFPGSPFEFWGKVNLMKAGIHFADLVSTSSPRYAEEVTASAEHGHGLQGVLGDRRGDLVGIVGGIDETAWDPRRDPALTAHFSVDDLGGKQRNKAELLDRCALDPDLARPLVVVAVTPGPSGGLAAVQAVEEPLLERDLAVVVLAAEDAALDAEVQALVERRPRRVAVVDAADTTLVHRAIAGADLLLMAPRIAADDDLQLGALRYGTLPVARVTGVLADTIVEGENGNGFRFDGEAADDLLAAVDRAVAAWRDPESRRRLQEHGMRTDVSWRRAAERTVDAYGQAIDRKRRMNVGSWSSRKVEQR